MNGLNIASLTSKYCENPEELSSIYIEGNTYDMKDILERFNELNM